MEKNKDLLVELFDTLIEEKFGFSNHIKKLRNSALTLGKLIELIDLIKVNKTKEEKLLIKSMSKKWAEFVSATMALETVVRTNIRDK